MVEHSLKIFTSEEKATNTTTTTKSSHNSNFIDPIRTVATQDVDVRPEKTILNLPGNFKRQVYCV